MPRDILITSVTGHRQCQRPLALPVTGRRETAKDCNQISGDLKSCHEPFTSYCGLVELHPQLVVVATVLIWLRPPEGDVVLQQEVNLT